MKHNKCHFIYAILFLCVNWDASPQQRATSRLTLPLKDRELSKIKTRCLKERVTGELDEGRVAEPYHG